MQFMSIILYIVCFLTFFILFSANFCYYQSSHGVEINNILLNATSNKAIPDTSIPLNSERLQIIIKNETSDNSDIKTQTLALYGNSITAAGAIGGGVIGSWLTFRHNRKIEEQKNKEANEREEQKRLAQKKEEDEFNARIGGLVRTELEFFSYNLSRLLTLKENDIARHEAITKAMLNYTLQYPKLSLERRAKIFDTESLASIEMSYQYFLVFSQGFEKEFSRYVSKTITLAELKANLDIEHLKDVIDDSIELIKKQSTASDKESRLK
jgi:hypothetical protein